jgi:geranylgeranyl reductase family protein
MPATLPSYYDVIISGAGPAGATCALALKDAGLKVALLDRATFPRDKVCGDAIPGRAVKTLYKISPYYEAAFRAFQPKLATRRTSLFYKGRNISFNWTGEAYTSARMDFDNFLFTLAKHNSGADVHTNTDIKSVERSADGFVLTTKDGRTFACRMLVGADGAHSVTAKQLARRTIDRNNHVGSVRAYYSNISGLDANTTEVYFDKQFLPSYLWIFPLPGNTANVGFGMLSSEIARRKADLKKLFYEFINQSPELQARLGTATQTSPLEGFGLPLGATDVTISGDGFILTGDAASLIDPISGDGIGNAMLSGRLAAEQVVKCFRENNFMAQFIGSYDKQLFAAIGSELKTHYYARRVLAGAPVLLDAVFLAARSPLLKAIIKKGL